VTMDIAFTPRRNGTLALALLLAGCSSTPGNTSLNSIRQPVVEQMTHTLDLASAGSDIPALEEARLAAWFGTIGLAAGDHVTASGDPRQRGEVAAIAARHGVVLDDAPNAAAPALAPGTVRVSVVRSRAYVPNCPNWSDGSTTSFDNATSPGFGCAVNGNLAAMVADPQHLLHGARDTGTTEVMSATKAIASYRAIEPTGAGGLSAVSSQGGSGE